MHPHLFAALLIAVGDGWFSAVLMTETRHASAVRPGEEEQ